MKCKNCGKEIDSLRISVFNRDGSDSFHDISFEEEEVDAVVFETDQNWCEYELTEEEMMEGIRCPSCGKFPGDAENGIQVYDVVRVVFFKETDHENDQQIAVKKRLIYAEDLFEPVDFTVLQVRKGGPGSGKTMAMYEQLFRKRVELAPTIEAEPVIHAYWIKEQDEHGIDRGWKCSNCRGSVYEMTYEPYKGCPHCRAKMDGGIRNG